MEKWLGGAISGIILNSLQYLMPKRNTKNIFKTLKITNSHSAKKKKSSLVQSLCKNAGWPPQKYKFLQKCIYSVSFCTKVDSRELFWNQNVITFCQKFWRITLILYWNNNYFGIHVNKYIKTVTKTEDAQQAELAC